MATWLVVPAPQSRLVELRALLAQLNHDPEYTVIVTTDRDQISDTDHDTLPSRHMSVCHWDGMHFSQWINAGLDHVEVFEEDNPHEVLCIGSDARGHDQSARLLAEGMRRGGFVMASPMFWPDQHAQRDLLALNDLHRTVYLRTQGSCFMLAGEHGLRMDETFRWHYSDDDLEMQARQVGVVGLVNGTGLVHDTDHELDEDQRQHAIEDRERFETKWGQPPW